MNSLKEVKTLFIAIAAMALASDTYGQMLNQIENVQQPNTLDSSTEESAYMPVLEIGKTWRIKRYYRASPEMVYEPDPYYDLKVAYKTEDNGRDVFMMTIKPYGENDFAPYTLAYEENCILFFYSDEYCDYVPMMDFSVEVGDVIPDCEYEILKKEYKNIEGIDRCVITFRGPYSDKEFFWIEGIGAVSGKSITPMPEMISVVTKMSECSLDGICLYKESDLNILSLEPIVKQETDGDTLYDLSGRLASNPQKGYIYITTSKKKIIK